MQKTKLIRVSKDTHKMLFGLKVKYEFASIEELIIGIINSAGTNNLKAKK